VNPVRSLLDDAARLLPEVVALRRRIHRHPELGLDTPRTQQAVLEALDGLPLRITTGRAARSVVAVLDGDRPGPSVLLRADMDALPMPEDTGLEFASEVEGVMHSCGHDAHTAMLAGAAHLLAERRSALAGRVVLMFQPGEEGHAGAAVMLDEGLLDPVAVGEVVLAFAIHQSPTFRSGTVATRAGALLASTDEFQIVVRGRGGHASMPHDALDPVPIACEIVQALQAHVTRRVDAFDPAVVTVTRLQAGTTSNVIPETALLAGTIRTVSPRTRAAVREGVVRLAEGIASAHGATAEVRLTAGYPVTVNDHATADRVVELARDLLGPERVLELPSPVMGAEDFSYVLERVPGAMVFLGTRPPGVHRRDVAPNHSNRMVIDEDAMATGVALHAAVALHVLAGAG
jgi:hippurate hydrolase